jgi:hypothetical protein
MINKYFTYALPARCVIVMQYNNIYLVIEDWGWQVLEPPAAENWVPRSFFAFVCIHTYLKMKDRYLILTLDNPNHVNVNVYVPMQNVHKIYNI